MRISLDGRPSIHRPSPRATRWGVAPAPTRLGFTCVVFSGALALAGCDSEFQPTIESELTLTSSFVEYSPEFIADGTVPLLDGIANNLEWGSPDDPERPYTYIQVTSENGFGDPGVSKFVAVKSAYTALWDPVANDGQGAYRVRDIYFLLQWADLSPSRYKDSLIYTGIDLEAEEPRIRTRCVIDNPEATPNEIQGCVDDSLVTYIFDAEGNARPDVWRQDGRDDMIMMFLGDGTATDTEGRRFSDFGTQMIEDGRGGFGKLGTGFLDAWSWSASRTNPLMETTKLGDLGGDSSPVEGFSGYSADYHVNAMVPLTPDDGPCLWVPNFDTTIAPELRVPLRVWIPRSDPNINEQGANLCAQVNNGLPRPYLHRESVRTARFSPDEDEPRVFNYRPFLWDVFEPEQSTFWKPDHFVIGHLLGHDGRARCRIDQFEACFPGCPGQSINNDNFVPNCSGRDYNDPPHVANTLQVRSFGAWSPITRHWVVETLRPVRTPWGNTNTEGNEVQDHDFDGILTGQRVFYFSLALWDNQDDGGPHWGSQPVRIVINPPPPREDG